MATANNKIGHLYVNADEVRKNYLSQLSLTSQFKVSLLLGKDTSLPTANQKAEDLIKHLNNCGLLEGDDENKYNFMCAEAVLPGSTFDMGEEYGSRQGIIERFPNRRIFSDFSLTFYVDTEYKLIRLFEEWMNFIDPIYNQSGSYGGSPDGFGAGFLERPNYYRFQYPEKYKKNIAITKFERDFLQSPNDSSATKDQSTLTYYFVDAFPTNLTALPLSYEGSTITKTTVNFSYTRYTVNKHNSTDKITSNPSLGANDLPANSTSTSPVA